MKRAFIITVVSLVAFMIAMGIGWYVDSQALAVSNANLENLYQRSFFELVNNVNNMEVDVSKLLVSNDSTSQQKILTSIKQQTSEAQNNLSLLPVNSNTLTTTTQFVNQLNGYCTSLLKYDTNKIEEQESGNLKVIYDAVAQIKYELNNIASKIMQGYSIIDNLDGNAELDSFSINFSGLSTESIEYPSMIYDGPFSDALQNREVKGLQGEDCTEQEAEAFISEIIDDIVNLEYLGETEGKIVTHDFGVNTSDGTNFYVQISKKGKFLMDINANSIDGEEKISEENAIEIAKEFAKKMNVDVDVVWKATSNGVTYVNLAPVVDKVVIYPDLIKVKVDLVSGRVIGWEATGYAYNHTERTNLTPTISEEDAKAKISSSLKVENIRLSVIPLDFGGEILAYEFTGEFNNFTYYMYIDAYTGDQVRVLRVIQTDQGELLL